MTLGFGWTSAEGVPGRRRSRSPGTRTPGRRSGRTRRSPTGTSRASIEGPRPWGDQPGVALHLRVTDEFWGDAGPGLLRRADARTVRAHAIARRPGRGRLRRARPGRRWPRSCTRARTSWTQVNEWCDRMGLGYRVRMLDPVSEEIVMTAGEFAVMALEDVRHDPPVLVSPRGVGYGIGQLLPIIVQSLLARDGLMLVEQPEVHLHPRLQAEVGDLFVDTVISGRAQLLVETHSEHLVLRLLRRVREGVLRPGGPRDPLRRPRRRRARRSCAGWTWTPRATSWTAGPADSSTNAWPRSWAGARDRASAPAAAHGGSGWASRPRRWATAPRTRRCAGRSTRSCSRTSPCTGDWCSPPRRTSTCSSRRSKSLPTSLAKAWEVVLSSRRVRGRVWPGRRCAEVLGDILDPAWIDTELADDLELVLVEADQAELLGRGRGRVLRHHPVRAWSRSGGSSRPGAPRC